MSIIFDALKKAKGAPSESPEMKKDLNPLEPGLLPSTEAGSSFSASDKKSNSKSKANLSPAVIKKMGYLSLMFVVGIFAALLFGKNFFASKTLSVPKPVVPLASQNGTPKPSQPQKKQEVADPKNNKSQLSLVADGSSGFVATPPTSKVMSPEEAELRKAIEGSVQEQDWETVVRQYDQILVINALDPELYNNYGVALRKTGQFEKAKAAYLQALALDPAYAEAMNNLAVVLMAKNEYALAKRVLQKAIETDPDYIDPYLHMGIALEKNGELEAAREYYQTYLRLSEKTGDRRVRLQVEERLAQLKDRF